MRQYVLDITKIQELQKYFVCGIAIILKSLLIFF